MALSDMCKIWLAADGCNSLDFIVSQLHQHTDMELAEAMRDECMAAEWFDEPAPDREQLEQEFARLRDLEWLDGWKLAKA